LQFADGFLVDFLEILNFTFKGFVDFTHVFEMALTHLEIVVQLMVDILYFIVFALDVVDFRTGL
jgi:hypothetical protein